MHWLEGVTSNTDAAHLAEKFAETKLPTKVCVIPIVLCKAMHMRFYFFCFDPNFASYFQHIVLLHQYHTKLMSLSSLGGWCSCYIKWGSQESVC